MGPAPGTAAELAEILAEVRRVEVLGRRLAGGTMSGNYGSVFRGAGIEFDDVREYEEGDDPRSIDWGVTARTGRTSIRRYRDERERMVLFAVDLSPSMAGGFGPWSARQVAARVVACLALSAARNHDRTGLLAFGEGPGPFVRPRRGPRHVLRLVRDCLALPLQPGRTDLAAALEFSGTAVGRHAIVFVLSDFLATGWEEAMARCARRHDLVAVRLLLPEIDLPRAGLLRIRDPESGRETVIDAGSPRVRREAAAAAARWREGTAAAIRRAGADLMDVPVPRAAAPGAIAGPILKFFRMRELRAARGRR